MRFYRCVGQTARFNVPQSLLEDQDLGSVIEHAVAQTILSHPVLQVGIVGEDTPSPYFVYLPSLDLSKLVRWEQVDGDTPAARDAALQRVLEARHSELWPDLHQQPGYEFIVLSPNLANRSHAGSVVIEIVFAFHHGYGDGTSGVILQRTLLRALNNPIAVPSFNFSTHVLTIDTPAPLPPPQDALINFKISWSFLLKSLWDEFGPSLLKPTPPVPAWAGKHVTLHPDSTCLRLLSFPPPTASGIVAHCREKSTTLTPLLHVLVLRSLVKRLPEHAISNNTLTCGTPISLRRLLPPGGKQGFDPDTSMGVVLATQDYRFSSSTICQIRAGGNDSERLVWDLTSSFGKDLKRKVASLPNDDITALMAWVSDYNAWWRKKLGKEREETWQLSNVGAADFDADDEKVGWSVDRVVFSQSGHVAGSAFSVSVSGVKGGDLAITLSWQESIVDDELLDGVAVDLREWLTTFARTGRFGFAA